LNHIYVDSPIWIACLHWKENVGLESLWARNMRIQQTKSASNNRTRIRPGLQSLPIVPSDSVAFGSTTIRCKRNGQAIGVASRSCVDISLIIFSSLTFIKCRRSVISELTSVANIEPTYGWSIKIALPLSDTQSNKAPTALCIWNAATGDAKFGRRQRTTNTVLTISNLAHGSIDSSWSTEAKATLDRTRRCCNGVEECKDCKREYLHRELTRRISSTTIW